MSLNIIARKDYEDLQKEILNLKEQENMASLKKVACPLYPNYFDEVKKVA